MSSVTVTPMEPGMFGVQVTEGDTVTSHRVRVAEAMLEQMALPDVETATIVEESIAFLLEREPARAILREFSLNQISEYFPEYQEELRRRLGQ